MRKNNQSFADLFEEALKNIEMKPGATVSGIVIAIDSDWVTVHAGLRSEGVIPAVQFLNERGELIIQVGDEVQVALDAVEDGFGETRLFREKAKRREAWEDLAEAFKNQNMVKGIISGKLSDGFTVDIRTIRAFLPYSQLHTQPLTEPTQLEGKELEFIITEFDQRRNNIVVSRLAALTEQECVEQTG